MHETVQLQPQRRVSNNLRSLNERNEEVKDIIERMPVSFGLWVGLIIIVLSALLFVFGYLVKYPDVLRGQLTISSSKSPVKLISGTAGRIELLQNRTGVVVKSGEYVAVIKNAADCQDIRIIDSLLRKVNIHEVNFERHRRYFPEDVVLGEVSSKYFAFLNALYQFLDYYREKPYEQQRDILGKFNIMQKRTLEQDSSEFRRLKEKYAIAESFYKRELALFEEKVIAAAELEQAHIALITSEQEFKAIDRGINNNNYQIQDAANKMSRLKFQKLDKDREFEVNLLNTFYDIQDAISQWEHRYAFVAPIEGKVEFLNFWKDDDFVQTGQEMFSIIPTDNQIYGKALLPEVGAGKVKIGQTVIIKLDGYPYTQFGSVKGRVREISAVTNEQALSTSQSKINAYLITMDLPNGLHTNYGSELQFHFEAKGAAEIITDDRRLIERLFDNLKHSIK